MQVPPAIQQLLASIPDHTLCGQNAGITSQEKLATVHSTTPDSGGAAGGGTPLTGSILTDDAVLNDLQPGEKQAYNSVKSTQVDELFDVVTKFSADEFLKTALANTIHANSANVQVQPQQQLATKPVQQQTPGQIPNPNAINGLHQTMQQLMPGAANPTQGMPLLAPSPAPGALSQPGLSGGQGGKATAVPGLAGQAATNVIDQQGALDASGTTVDGNHSSLVSKAAAAGGIGNMLQSLGYKAVNNNQPQVVHSDGKSYSLQDLMNHASGRLPAGETPDSLDIVEAMMSLDAAKQKQAGMLDNMRFTVGRAIAGKHQVPSRPILNNLAGIAQGLGLTPHDVEHMTPLEIMMGTGGREAWQQPTDRQPTPEEEAMNEDEIMSDGMRYIQQMQQVKQKTASAYGYCPKCGAPGTTRERRINGDDTCEKGHKYPSRSALKQPRRGQR